MGYQYQMLIRCLGWRKRRCEDHILSYANALLKTDSESVEMTICRRRISIASFVARLGEERLPRRMVFWEIFGGKGYSGQQSSGWMNYHEDHLLSVRHQVSMVTRGRTKGRQMVPTSGERGEGLHAEMTQGLKEGNGGVRQDYYNRDCNR